MEKEFSKKQLIEFGNYLLSTKRRELVQESYQQNMRDGIANPFPIEERLKQVYDSDLNNWETIISKISN